MSKILSHNFTGKSLTFVYIDDGNAVRTKIVEKTHINWDAIMGFYKEGQYSELLPLLDVTDMIKFASGGKITIVNDKVYYNGQPTSGYLFEKILFFLKELPKQYPRLVKFAENLFENPSEEARQKLYKFLENGNMPITEDGYFLAYKGVTGDFWSKTSGKIDKLIQGQVRISKNSSQHHGDYQIYNGVGETIEVDRGSVNPNSDQDCSWGLHVGSHSYASDFKGFDGKLMIVKVHPKDVCAVPASNKMRCCKYEVISEDGQVLDEKLDGDYDKVAKVHYHNNRGPDGKFISGNMPKRLPNGRFAPKN